MDAARYSAITTFAASDAETSGIAKKLLIRLGPETHQAAVLQLLENRKPWLTLLRVGLVAILLGLVPGRFDISACAASQLTIVQATERCRESAGRPFVQSCVRAKVQASGGPPPKYIEGCRAAARPAVQACVTKMMAVTGGDAKGDTAVSAVQPTADLKSVSTENVAFVAPPRSAADVTEILDKQKPDPDRIAKLVAQADPEPPPASSRSISPISTTSAPRRAPHSAVCPTRSPTRGSQSRARKAPTMRM